MRTSLCFLVWPALLVCFSVSASPTVPAPDDQETSAVAASGNGYFVVWADKRNYNAMEYDGLSDPVNITVTPSPFLPVVTVQATDPIASEPGKFATGDSGVFTINASYATDCPLEIHYKLSGTASNGVDYSRLSGAVVLHAGSLDGATRRPCLVRLRARVYWRVK